MSGLRLPFEGHWPEVHNEAFVAPDATLVGQVSIGPESSVWYKCVLRGDEEPIRIGARTNIQDGTVIHVAGGYFATEIGDDVSVGHMALIHACALRSGAFVGMRAVVMDGAVVEGGAVVAAGALVPPGKHIPAGQLWAGTPARFVRELTEKDRKMVQEAHDVYLELARQHRTAQTGMVPATTPRRAAGD